MLEWQVHAVVVAQVKRFERATVANENMRLSQAGWTALRTREHAVMATTQASSLT